MNGEYWIDPESVSESDPPNQPDLPQPLSVYSGQEALVPTAIFDLNLAEFWPLISEE